MKFFLGLAISFFVFILLLVIFLINFIPLQYPDNISKKTNFKQVYEIKKDDLVKDATSPVADLSLSPDTTPAPLPTLTNTPAPLPEIKATDKNQIAVTINDIMDQPIGSGELNLEGKTYLYKGGSLLINDITSEIVEIKAFAAEYQSATKTVNLRETRNINFNLDYYSDFLVQVMLPSTHAPVAGAEVFLYKAKLCERPIPKNFRIYISPDMNNSHPYSAGVDEGKVKIKQLMDGFEEDEEYVEASPDKILRFIPKAGDEIASIGSASWESGLIQTNYTHPYYFDSSKAVSCRGRILDTLNLSMKADKDQGFYEFIRLGRKGENGRATLQFSSGNHTEPYFKTLKTDAGGKAHITGLIPGLYYIQAKHGSMMSAAYPLFPSTGGVKLELAANCNLTITATIGNIPANYKISRNLLKDVVVKLNSLEEQNHGIYTGNTDADGRILLKTIPFGEYNLQATPPDLSTYQQISKKILINRPEQSLRLNFDSKSLHTIEGIVLQHDSKEPVPDIEVTLLEMHRGGYDSAAKTKSDKEGKFTFPNLPKNRYKVAFVQKSLDNALCYPYNEKITNARDDRQKPFIGRNMNEADADYASEIIVVGDQPTYPVTLYLVKLIKTQFSGKVVYDNQRIAAGAILEFNKVRSLPYVLLPGYFIESELDSLLPKVPASDNEGKILDFFPGIKRSGEAVFFLYLQIVPQSICCQKGSTLLV